MNGTTAFFACVTIILVVVGIFIRISLKLRRGSIIARIGVAFSAGVHPVQSLGLEVRICERGLLQIGDVGRRGERKAARRGSVSSKWLIWMILQCPEQEMSALRSRLKDRGTAGGSSWKCIWIRRGPPPQIVDHGQSFRPGERCPGRVPESLTSYQRDLILR